MADAVAAPSGGGGAPPATNGAAGTQTEAGGGPPTTDVVQPPGQQKVPPKPTVPDPPARLKRKLVIDGKEVEEEASENDLWDSYRKGKTADKRFAEAAQVRKEAQAIAQQHSEVMELIKAGKLRQALRHINPDADGAELLANELQAVLNEQEEMADPNTRARVAAERKAAELQDRFDQAQRDQDISVFEQHVATKVEEFKTAAAPVFASVGLPVDDDTMSLYAQAEQARKEHGLDITPELMAKSVRDLVIGRFETMATGIQDDEQLLELMPSLTTRIHKALLSRHAKRKAAQTQQSPVDQFQQQQQREPEKALEQTQSASEKLRRFNML